MGLTMRDESVKVQLFRLVEALPALKTDRSITRHLREYFQTVSDRLPPVLQRSVNWIPRDGFLGGLVAAATRKNATRLAHRFIAGTTADQTLKTIESLRADDLGFTIDLLGEAVLSESEASEYQRQYLTFIEAITARAATWTPNPLIDQGPFGPIPKVNVSVKLSSLYSQFDPIDPDQTSRAVRERLRPILRLALQHGALRQHRHGAIRLQRPDHPHFSAGSRRRRIPRLAQCRHCDSGVPQELQRRSAKPGQLVQKRGTPIWVRLVKGAYWDYETVIAAQQNWPSPVWEQKPQTDANFERQTQFLVEHHELLRPAIASHNIRSVAHALALEEQYKLPPRTVEFQMLYGMEYEIKATLVQMGRRVRVYTPFGQLLPGMAYLVRRLLENTSNQSFLRAGFSDGAPIEELLMNPQTKSKAAEAISPRIKDAIELPPFAMSR